jgi:hypothetical protein
MHRALLVAATAALASTSPALAQGAAAAGFSLVGSGQRVHADRSAFRIELGRGAGADRRHRRHIRVRDRDRDGALFGDLGYNDYGDYDANRSFDPDKWNDWWHERPERAFPRWMSRNRDCARPWYSGDVLTC